MEIRTKSTALSPTIEIKNIKLKLVNLVCSTLLYTPNFYSSSQENQLVIKNAVRSVALRDPEFILKLAYYVREDLNLRSTANFLLALAANIQPCHVFLKKYFAFCVRLPTDILEVCEVYLNLPDKHTNNNALPASLRKAIAAKFKKFDVYQLGKYNKRKSSKKKQNVQIHTKKPNIDQFTNPEVVTFISYEAAKSTPRGNFTLKQLIRKVHISQPADCVMGIVGKRYPATEENFAKSGLSGTFDKSKIGKRMRIPIPETWETMLSAKGNKSSTWEELIDHNKLPFMAMLRNLRNLLITGISPKHHLNVINRLTDERQVTNSRQLPWRFLSAYQSIEINLEQLMNQILDHEKSGKTVTVELGGRQGKHLGKRRTITKKAIIPTHMPDFPLIEQYRTAIDTAIKISVSKNLTMISGNTVVFCDVSGSMKCPCSTAGKMASIQTVMDVAILLGLMIQHSSEKCDYRIFSSPKQQQQHALNQQRPDIAVPLMDNTILKNIEKVHSYRHELGGGTDFPYEYLEELIQKKVKIDTFIILSDMIIAPGQNEMSLRGFTVSGILKKYREKVNPDLLFVAIDLYGAGKSLVSVTNTNKNVLITGFSDNILRYIAENGHEKQLNEIETIDKRITKKKSEQNKQLNLKEEENAHMILED